MPRGDALLLDCDSTSFYASNSSIMHGTIVCRTSSFQYCGSYAGVRAPTIVARREIITVVTTCSSSCWLYEGT